MVERLAELRIPIKVRHPGFLFWLLQHLGLAGRIVLGVDDWVTILRKLQAAGFEVKETTNGR